MQVVNESENDLFNRIWSQITPELITPKVFLERSWELNGGTKNHFIYLARPFPKYRLGALYQSFKDYLETSNVPHDQKTTVGGRYHRYQKKSVLEMKRFKINQAFLSVTPRNVYNYRTTFRASWAGFTLAFWVRVVCVTVYKNYQLEDPVGFVASLLNNTVDPLNKLKKLLDLR